MIEYLQKIAGKGPKVLTEKEELELEHLKKELAKFKEIEKQENQNIEASEGSESDSQSEDSS